MRILSYNVLDGGEGRADPLAEVIEAQRPDIVALIEADHVDVLERIANRLEMDSIRGEGNGHAVAILSRWPIVETMNHAAVRARPRCLLEARIAGPDGVEWIVGALHLLPGAFEADEQEREIELEEVLEVFEPHRRANRPHLLAGDFNADSPVQQIDPAKCKPKTREAWEKNGGQIPRRVIQRVLDAGYVDSFHSIDPAGAARTGSFTTQFPGQRVDFIFTHGIDRLRLRKGWVEQDRLAKYASDHFPVGLEID